MTPGASAIVLHAHLPFVRHPEHEDFLEEHWLFEAMIESYLPLIEQFSRLASDGVPFRVSLNLSPTLLAMLRDPLLIARFRRRVALIEELCEKELARRGGGSHDRRMAAWYQARLRRLMRVFDGECRGDLPGAFAQLARAAHIELIGCAATHAFLPLLHAATPAAARAQVAIGIAEFGRHFGFAPRGFWLPECAYAPGLDAVMADHGVRWFVVESSAAGGFHGTLAPVSSPAGPVAVARDRASAEQVWSATGGYPGDPAYREFYRDVAHVRPERYLRKFLTAGVRCDTGLKYWRVTGAGEAKRGYDPARAGARAREHAAHFVAERIAQLRATTHRNPLVTSPYDCELFGHWWFEGPQFLGEVFREAQRRGLRMTTPSEHLEEGPRTATADLPFSSWGEHGDASVWLNAETGWIYPRLHRMAETLREAACDSRSHARAVAQAGREMLLAQASDWPFLITRGGARDYARSRLESHFANFDALARRMRRPDAPALAAIEARNNLFPALEAAAFR